MAATKIFPGSVIQTVFNDATADDSDKTFTPTSRMRIQSVIVVLVTTGTAGNRQLTLEVLDGSDLLYSAKAGAVQAASGTVTYNFAEGNARETSAVDGILDVPLPTNLQIQPGYTVRVYDSAAVDAAADDMTVRIVAETW